MPILARLYNGKVLEFPDDTPMEVVNRVAQEQVDLFRAKEQPAPVETPVISGPPPSTERTYGQAIGDIGASAISGVGSMLSFPGQVASLVPGLREAGQALAYPGEAIQRFGDRLKSEGLKAREALRSQALSEAEKDGVLSEFATAITSTLKDPALISSFIAEQAPLLLPPAAMAKLVQILGRGTIMAASRGLMGEAAESAAKAAAERVNRRAYAAALGTGATMQGADISSDTYQRAYQAALLQGKPPEQAADEATNAARLAFFPAAATTVLTQRLPGASAIEARMAGLPGVTGRVRSAFGEATQESLEEGAGALFSNLGVRTVDPNVSLTEGVGAAAGLGALGGGFFGAMLGKKDKPALAPGQREGETIEQTINRLTAERQQLMAEPEAQARPFPSAVEMIEMINRDPARGYTQLEDYIQQLRNMPSSPEQQQALATAVSLGKSFREEQISRMTPSNRNVITGKDLKDTGLSTQDPVFKELTGKDLAKPDQVMQVLGVLQRELERTDLSPERYTALTTLRTGIDNYLTALPGSAFYAGEIDESGRREGVGVDLPAGGDTTGTAGTTERGRVAGTGEPATEDLVDEAAQFSPLSFQTAQGSTYAIDELGRTIRTKRSAGPGQGTTYPPHDVLYVTPEQANYIIDERRARFGEKTSVLLGYRDGNLFRHAVRRSDIPEGAQPAVAVINAKREVLFAFPAQLTPAIGLTPVEKLYNPDGTATTHIGNPIVRVNEGQKAKPKAAPKTKPRTVKSFAKAIADGQRLETPEDVQFYQNNGKAIDEELRKIYAAQGPSKKSIRPEELEARYRELEARARKPEAPAKPVEAKPPTPEETARQRRIGEIDKQLTNLMTRLLRQYGLNDVGVELIKSTKANGEYANRLIRLADDTTDPVVHLRHESIHALKELKFFTPQQWKTLEQKAKAEWVNTYLKNVAHDGNQSRYDAYMEMFQKEGKTAAEAEQAIIEEAIADAFSFFQRTKAPAGLMQSILKRLNNFFSAIKEFLRIGNLSADQIFGKIEAGELRPAKDRVPAQPMGAAKQSLVSGVPKSTRMIMEANTKFAQVELGLKTEKVKGATGTNNVRDIARALNNQTLNNFGGMTANDVSAGDANDLARALADEIGYQLRATATTGTGLGWYSYNYPNAVDKLAARFPELKTNKTARAVFTACVAVSSNGENVTTNINNAILMYEDVREGKPIRDIGVRRADAFINNKRRISELLEQFGDNFAAELMKVTTVKAMNAQLRAQGQKTDGSYLANTEVPVAAIYFGPKLGAFYANLMGAEGYLTMDMWWTRTINRMRGLLMPQATEASINKFRTMMGQPDATRDEVVAATIPFRNKYEEQGYVTELEFLAGEKQPTKKAEVPAWTRKAKRMAGAAYPQLEFEHRLEKMANTIYKNEYEMLEEAPFTGSDRAFMYKIARDAQRILKQEGINLSVADIQAAIWYYEKRLYAKLSERVADDIGYDEAIAKSAASGRRAGPSLVFPDKPNAGYVPPGSNTDVDRVREEPGEGRGGPSPEAPREAKLSLRSDKPAATEAMDLVRKAQAYKPQEGEPAVVFPLLFHSGTGDPASLATYIEPQFGSWVTEVLSGATDEEVDTETFVPLSYYASKPEWVRMQTARKLNKPVADITQDDVRQYGQLAIVYNVDDEFGDAVNKVYQIGPEGYNGGYTNVVDVYGKSKKLYETDLEEEGDYRGSGKTLFGVEPGDIVSKETIEPNMVLVGDALIDFLDQYKTEVEPNLRFSLRSELTAAERDLRVRWADSRIEQLLSANAYLTDGREKDTKGFAAAIRPNDFLNATASEEDRQRIAAETGPLDPDRLAQEDQELFLEIAPTNEEGVYQIKNHEGRHRMTALMNAGYNGRIPVVLLLNRKNAETEEEVYLRPQQFRVDKELITAPRGIFIPQMIPINWEQRKELREVFGGEADLKFSLRSQTQTPAFKRWFGDSKVVDENGEPLVVYHGTGFDFDVFEGARKGTEKAYFFAKSPELASGFALTSAAAYDGNANVMPVYLTIKNPLVIDYKGNVKWGNDRLMKQMLNQVWDGKYDGVIAKNVIDGSGEPTTIYAVIKPTQVKSAIGNVGTFSPIDPDIRKSLRAKTSTPTGIPNNIWMQHIKTRKIASPEFETMTSHQKSALTKSWKTLNKLVTNFTGSDQTAQELMARMNFISAIRDAIEDEDNRALEIYKVASPEEYAEEVGEINDLGIQKTSTSTGIPLQKTSTPIGIPNNIWMQHVKVKNIELSAYGTMTPQQKSAITKSWKTLYKLAKDFTGSDQAALDLMAKMNTISGIRDAIEDGDTSALEIYKVTAPELYAQEVPEAAQRAGVPLANIKPRVATWFSGARTLEAALGDVEAVMAVESDQRINEFANSVFGTAFIARNVVDVNPDEVKAVSPVLFHASPVCKNFSAAKTFRGADEGDQRSAEAVARVIAEAKPPIVTIENVPKYASTGLFQHIVKVLEDNGYKWDVVIHDAADYGAAQSRKRMLLRAVREGELPDLPEKSGPSDWYKTIEDLIPDAPNSTIPPVERGRLEDMISRGQLDPSKPIITMGGSGFRGTWAAANAGGPSPTLKAANEKPRVILPDGTVKVVTPRMMARLMGLPDSYPVPDSASLAKVVLGNGIHGSVTRSLINPLLSRGSPKRGDDVVLAFIGKVAKNRRGATLGARSREETIRAYQGLKTRIGALIRKLIKAEGEKRVEQVLDIQDKLKVLDEYAKDLKSEIDATKPPRRTPEDFLARITKAYADGDISTEVFEAARAIYDKYPQLLDGLKLGIRKAPGSGIIGDFVGFARLIRLYKETEGVLEPDTIRHEIAHSMEQMMDADQRAAVIDEYTKQLKRAIEKNKDNPEAQKYFDAVLKFLANPSQATHQDAMRAMPSYDFYQYLNPSEYWAVNAEPMLKANLGNAWNRFKINMRRVFEGLKSVFGLNNKYQSHKTMRALLQGTGERISSKVLVDYIGDANAEINLANIDPNQQRRDDVDDLLNQFNRPDVPSRDTKTSLKTLLPTATRLRELYRSAQDADGRAADSLIGPLHRGLAYARNKLFFSGAGLEEADARRYGRQVVTDNDQATATLALDNMLHGGGIAVEFLYRGGIEYNPNTKRFQATVQQNNMMDVYRAEKSLKDEIGVERAEKLINGYLEAKRSRSIKDEIESLTEDIEEASDRLQDANDDLQRLLTDPSATQQSINTQTKLVDRMKAEIQGMKNQLDDITRINEEKVLMDDAEIDAFIGQENDFPQLRQIMDNWTAQNHRLLGLMRQVRLISDVRYDRLMNIKDYVPWQRVQDDDGDIHGPAPSRSITRIPKEPKFKKGKTERPIEYIIDNMTDNLLRLTMNSLRQYAAGRIVSEYATRNEKGQIKTFPKEDRDKNRFPYIIDGRRTIVEIKDPLIAEAVYGSDSIDIRMNAALEAATNFVRRAITIDPFFQMAQVIKDAPTAAVVTGVKNPAALMGRVMTSFAGTVFDTDPVAEILRANGIGGFQSIARTPEKRLKQKIGIATKSVPQATLALLDHIGDASDFAARMAAYKQTMAESGDEALALYRASNVINFNRLGSSRAIRYFIRYVNFANAYLQSVDTLVTALSGRGMRGRDTKAALAVVASTMASLTGATLLYSFLVGGDEEYEKLDDATKARNFFIPKSITKEIGLENGILIPMNTTASFLFKALPELTYQAYVSQATQTPVDAARYKKAVSEAAADALFGPEPVPSAIRPIIEIGMNRSFFTEKPLTPRGMETLEKSRQFTDATSEISKQLGEFGLLSPIEWDHLIRGTTGVAGMMVQYGSNMIGEALNVRPEATAKQAPFVGRFVAPEVGRGREALFYDLHERVRKATTTLKDLEKTGEIDKAEAFEKENEQLIGLSAWSNRTEARLKKINEEIRLLSRGKEEGTAAQRRKEITELQREKSELLEGIEEIRKRDAGL